MQSIIDTRYLIGCPALAEAFRRDATSIMNMYRPSLESDNDQVRRNGERYAAQGIRDIERSFYAHQKLSILPGWARKGIALGFRLLLRLIAPPG